MKVLQVVRAGWGLLQLAAPGLVADRILRKPLDHRAEVVARVLAARQVLQAGLLMRSPTPAVLGVGAGVDGLHAASMLALAAVDTRRRPAALLDAAIAAAFAVAGAVGARHARPH
ncbi:hypothetical protein RHODO2019_06120 [Rhodococcus antarcticus]|uniref:Uncharacterized protein n=1 Tax=Rhodococcus antarcticus TaxID=2987751 RepID=A0ABY6P2Y1_9NOCA|nr:hypothetical protein [Rhodococcus antarcticus]UZJ26005.1 hypothetical protein RHODO2019_06120 [Rhodococcus antarcticus]